MRGKEIDLNEIFVQVYKTYPAKTVHKDNIENSNNI